MKSAAPALLLILTACVSTPVDATPAPEEQREKAAVAQQIAAVEASLVKPFDTGNTVICDTLVVEVSPLFLNKHVVQPAGEPRRTERGDHVELRWRSGDEIRLRVPQNGLSTVRAFDTRQQTVNSPTQYFKVRVGNTAFIVASSITVRVPMRGAPTLTTVASGRVMVTRDFKSKKIYDELRIVDGKLSTKALAAPR